MGFLRRAIGAVTIAGASALALFLAAASPVTADSPPVTLHASRGVAPSGAEVTLSGTVSGATAPTTVVLDQSRYPYPQPIPIAHATTSATGQFSFAVELDRSTRFTAVVAGVGASAAVTVLATDPASIRVRALPLGQAGVSVLVFHPADLRWGGANVQWWFKAGWRGRWMAAPATRAKRLSQYVVNLADRSHAARRQVLLARVPPRAAHRRAAESLAPARLLRPRLPRRRQAALRVPESGCDRAGGRLPANPDRAHGVRRRRL